VVQGRFVNRSGLLDGNYIGPSGSREEFANVTSTHSEVGRGAQSLGHFLGHLSLSEIRLFVVRGRGGDGASVRGGWDTESVQICHLLSLAREEAVGATCSGVSSTYVREVTAHISV